MEKISIHDLNFKAVKALSKNNRSKVYKLASGQVLKIFNQNILNLYEYFGNSIEKKILDSKIFPNIPEIVIPNKAVYSRSDKFIGYTSDYINGLNLGDYYNSLDNNDIISLQFYASFLEKLEDTVKRANDKGFVFPDLVNPGNIIFDKDGNFKLLDYDGMQINGNRAMAISRALCPEDQYLNVPKYSKDRHLYTEQLDKKSIILLFMILTFNINLNIIGKKAHPSGELITLDYLFNYIGLNDFDLMHKIWKIYSKEEENEFISKDLYRLAEDYALDYKPALERGKKSYKYLIKNR